MCPTISFISPDFIIQYIILIYTVIDTYSFAKLEQFERQGICDFPDHGWRPATQGGTLEGLKFNAGTMSSGGL